jgi:uncharacterized protein (DUF924 family)
VNIIDEIVAFWFETLKPEDWYRKNPAIDAAIAARFNATYEALKTGVPPEWIAEPKGVLAAILVLDQFPRNMFRDDARAFATDQAAMCSPSVRLVTGSTCNSRQRSALSSTCRSSTRRRTTTKRAPIALFTSLSAPLNLDFARRHQAIIARFGRFPHRNSVLGHASTVEELAFLQEPGSSF